MTCDHILLIGIDAYRAPKTAFMDFDIQPLRSAANDVDALHGIFLRRIGVSKQAIIKLVARQGAPRDDEHEATLANIRQALERLTTEVVGPDDRVFIYYGGHGTRIEDRGIYAAREALVPVDVEGPESVMYDDEVNEILQKIASRTSDVTAIFDCCFSASVTRGAFTPGHVRTCRVPGLAPRRGNAATRGIVSPRVFPGPTFGAGRVRETTVYLEDPSDPGYVVVAVAQSSEPAEEVRNAQGVWHSVFMAAFLEILERRFVGDICGLRWADIWPALCAEVSALNPKQHPCLLGRNERRVFGGPYQPGDSGFPIDEVHGKYRIGAGYLAGLGAGAEIGIYGVETAFFPPLGSSRDKSVCRGVLKVESATLSSAIAVAKTSDISLAVGARGRLLKPGKPDLLVVQLDPYERELATYLQSAAHVQVVAGESNGEVVVRRASNGRWWIGDEVFGADEPLAWVNRGDDEALARGLMHYARYNRVLRLARRSPLGEQRLVLMVLDASNVGELRRQDLGNPWLGEVGLDTRGGCDYRLIDGQSVCFSIRNTSSRRLYVQLFNCASSGKVEMLGTQQVEIAPGERQIFWRSGHQRNAFRTSISPGRTSNVDRLVAVGTEEPNIDLTCLRVDETLEQAMRATRRGHGGEAGIGWDACRVKVRIVRP